MRSRAGRWSWTLSLEEMMNREVELGLILSLHVVPQQQCNGHCPCDSAQERQLKQQLRSAQVAGQWRGDTALTLPLFWRRSTVSPVFFGRFPRSSLSLSRPLPTLLSCCLTSTEARWPIRDCDRVGTGQESERFDRGNRPKKTGETVDRRQNNGSVKAMSPPHCPATCAQRNCSFNCYAGQSLRQCPLHRC